MKTLITNANVVTLEQVIEQGAVVLDGGKIAYVGKASGVPGELAQACEETVDAAGGWVLPGFIDIHVHGGYGSDFMDSNKEVLDTITRFHRDNGTTSMLATTMTATKEDIERVLGEVYDYMMGDMPYAQLFGVHLEGPFLNPKYCGAQDPNKMVEPRLDWIQGWAADYPGIIRQLSLAPERNGALEMIKWVRSQGIVAALAHTNATYAEVQTAVEQGLNHAVHTFNAMTPLHHREPGVVGAVMSEDRICAELIADGHHVHPTCIGILAKLKTNDNMILITDAMSAAGLGDGQYALGGLAVTVKDGVARLTEGNSLAGSTLTMIEAFRYVVQKVGLSVQHASRIASYTAAKQFGIDNVTGSIAEGKQADVLLVSESLELQRVWVKGRA